MTAKMDNAKLDFLKSVKDAFEGETLQLTGRDLGNGMISLFVKAENLSISPDGMGIFYRDAQSADINGNYSPNAKANRTGLLPGSIWDHITIYRNGNGDNPNGKDEPADDKPKSRRRKKTATTDDKPKSRRRKKAATINKAKARDDARNKARAYAFPMIQELYAVEQKVVDAAYLDVPNDVKDDGDMLYFALCEVLTKGRMVARWEEDYSDYEPIAPEEWSSFWAKVDVEDDAWDNLESVWEKVEDFFLYEE